MEFVRHVVDADILKDLETATDEDGVEEEDAEVVKLDYYQATRRIGAMRGAGALGNYDRGQGAGVRGSG